MPDPVMQNQKQELNLFLLEKEHLTCRIIYNFLVILLSLSTDLII